MNELIPSRRRVMSHLELELDNIVILTVKSRLFWEIGRWDPAEVGLNSDENSDFRYIRILVW